MWIFIFDIVRPVGSLNRLNKIFWLFILLIITSFSASGQCPDFAKEFFNIETSQNTIQIEALKEFDEDFTSMRVLIYNLDNKQYYFDTQGKEKIDESRRANVTINRNYININGITPGDFVLLLEPNGCPQKMVGWGYSGFPNSAIRIKE